MHHKTESLVIVGVIIAIMFAVGYMLSSLGDNITAAAVAEGCNKACGSSAECDDSNECTEDVCRVSNVCGTHCTYEKVC